MNKSKNLLIKKISNWNNIKNLKKSKLLNILKNHKIFEKYKKKKIEKQIIERKFW